MTKVQRLTRSTRQLVYIQANPGFSVLETVYDGEDERMPTGIFRDVVITWAIDSDGEHHPVAQSHGLCEYADYIETPLGTVNSADRYWDNAAEWLAFMQAEAANKS